MSVGSDNVSGIVLKQCAFELSVPLNTIFNNSLRSGEVPTIFKHANVTPVFKSGDASN